MTVLRQYSSLTSQPLFTVALYLWMAWVMLLQAPVA